jgi:hypothetical protein
VFHCPCVTTAVTITVAATTTNIAATATAAATTNANANANANTNTNATALTLANATTTATATTFAIPHRPCHYHCLKAFQYSVLWDFKSWFTFDANPFYFKLEQSSQLLRILLITTTLASLALEHSILATYFKVQGCSSYFRWVNSDHCKNDDITVFQWSRND